MLHYVAAFATVVTFAVGPIASTSQDNSMEKEPTKWTKAAHARTVEISTSIEVFCAQALYLLSTAEQRIFRKALLRSVKIVSPSRNIV